MKKKGWQLILATVMLLATLGSKEAAANSTTTSAAAAQSSESASNVKPVLRLTGSSHLAVGQTQQLKGQILNGQGQLRWRSSNSRVATVNQTGIVKGKQAGTVSIQVQWGSQKQRLKLKVAQQTNNTLNSKFKHARAHQTIILTGNFKLNGDVKLPTAKNVTVNALQASFTGKKGCFYGVLNNGLKWTGGYIYSGGHTFRLLRTSKASFSGITFHQACGVGGHIFDLMGCQNINIANNRFYGYGHTLDPKKLRRNGNHGQYAEAIQTDYANYDSGGTSFNKYGKGHFNGAPSSYITVSHNTWQPEYSGKRLVSLAQVPIGQHNTISSNRSKIKHITFTYNTVNDPLRLSGMGSDTNYFGAPVHFEAASSLNISHNQFNATMPKARPENWIIISNHYGHMSHTVNVKIEANAFSGYHVSRAIVRLITTGSHTIRQVRVVNNATNQMKLIERYGHTQVSYK